MNVATAIRELRKFINSESFDVMYLKYEKDLIIPGISGIMCRSLRKQIIIHYLVNNDKSLFTFAKGLTDGYRTGVDPKIIGSPINLRWLLAEVNSSKRQRSDITKDDLLTKYNEYENKKNH